MTKKQKIKESRGYRRAIFWLLMKYQLITKVLLGLLVVPLYSQLVSFLLSNTGRQVVSSGDFKVFFTTPSGWFLIILTGILSILFIGIDINAYIYMGGLIEEKRKMPKARTLLGWALKSTRQLLNISGLMIIVYVSLVLPLLDIGIAISPMRQFRIPNFITSVIYNQPLYFTLYVSVMLGLTYIAYRHIFVLHYLLIENESVRQALGHSREITKRTFFRLIKNVVFKSIARIFKMFIGIFIGFASIFVVFLLGLSLIEEDPIFSLALSTLTVSEFVGLIALVFGPILLFSLTQEFYQLNKEKGREVQMKIEPIQAKWLVADDKYLRFSSKFILLIAMLGLMVFNLVVSLVLVVVQDQVVPFLINQKIEIIAHRGGGDLGAENTVQGIEAAIKAGAKWTEVDIQRTKDGYYVINHDADFKRVAGESRTSSEMTLDEIKQLEVKNEFDPQAPSQPVALLEDIFTATKGKMGLFLELKGSTADEKMVDDVVKMIKEENRQGDAVILSLDYNIIQYTETNYPEIQTGYLYYFAFGQTNQLVGDYLVMEEREADMEKVIELKAAGKKVVVWTVNTEESIERFVNSAVDGIITDDVMAVKEKLIESNQIFSFERLIQALSE